MHILCLVVIDRGIIKTLIFCHHNILHQLVPVKNSSIFPIVVQIC